MINGYKVQDEGSTVSSTSYYFTNEIKVAQKKKVVGDPWSAELLYFLTDHLGSSVVVGEIGNKTFKEEVSNFDVAEDYKGDFLNVALGGGEGLGIQGGVFSGGGWSGGMAGFTGGAGLPGSGVAAVYFYELVEFSFSTE